MNKSGKLFVLSGPSGVGKGTICKKLMKKLVNSSISISMTTRQKRSGEKEGVNYFFVSEDEFKQAVSKDRLLEYAKVYDNYYGTPKDYVFSKLEVGENVFLEIDVQGALNVKKNYPDAVLIFIMPPSIRELENRITKRGKDDPVVIRKRMNAAKKEMNQREKYDFVVVNNRLGAAVESILNYINSLI